MRKLTFYKMGAKRRGSRGETTGSILEAKRQAGWGGGLGVKHLVTLKNGPVPVIKSVNTFALLNILGWKGCY